MFLTRGKEIPSAHQSTDNDKFMTNKKFFRAVIALFGQQRCSDAATMQLKCTPQTRLKRERAFVREICGKKRMP